MAEVVCQVLARAERLSVIWSQEAATFEPYYKTGTLLTQFHALVRQTRERLHDLAAAASSDDRNRAGFALAQAGHALFRELFTADVAQLASSEEIRDWFQKLASANTIASLEVLSDQPDLIPWNALYEQAPDAGQFSSGGDAWQHFWGVKYRLHGNRRVSPLRQLGVLSKPEMQFILDPQLRERLPAEDKKRLTEFLAAHTVLVATNRTQLEADLRQTAPDIIFCLCRTAGDRMLLGNDILLPEELQQLSDPTGGVLVFATLGSADWQSAQPSGNDTATVSARLATLPFGGLVAVDAAADHVSLRLPLLVLERFLHQQQPLAQVLQDLRRAEPAVGLLVSGLVPGNVLVESEGEQGSEGIKAPETRTILPSGLVGRPGHNEVGRPGHNEGTDADEESEELPLPEKPYRPLRPLEADAEAMFVGRENDLQRLALTLDEAETRLVVLHGLPGVGKSSLLRAGLVPFLDEDSVGYHILDDRIPAEEADQAEEAEPTVLTIRASGDLTGQLAMALTAFCSQPYRFDTPTQKTVEIDFVALLGPLVEGLVVKPEVADQAELDPEVLRQALVRDTELLARLLTALTERLPFELVVVIEQGEELFTLNDDERTAQHDLAQLRRAVQSLARIKWVLALRTEYCGRLLHHLQPRAEAGSWLKSYLVEPLSRDDLLLALVLPTADEPLPFSSEIPFRKYGFVFEEGLPEKIVAEVLAEAEERQLSAVALLQVVGTRLAEVVASRAERVVRERDVRDLGLPRLKTFDKKPALANFFASLVDSHPVREGSSKVVANYIRARLGKLPRQMGDRYSLEVLLNRLVFRQADGTSVRDLLSLTELQKEWRGNTPLETMVSAASAEEVGLLEAETLNVAGAEDTYVSLVSDVAATVLAQEAVAKDKKDYGHSRMVDALWITVPLMILMAVAAYSFLWRPFSALRENTEVVDEQTKKLLPKYREMEGQVTALQFPAYVAQVQLAQQALEGGDPVKLRQYLLRCQDLAVRGLNEFQDPRSFDWYYLWQQAHNEQKALLGHRDLVTGVAVSADGKTAVSGSRDKTVRLWDLEKGLERVRFVGHARPVTTVALSPDGKQVASVDDGGGIWLWDTTVAKGQFLEVTKPALKLDGHKSAVTTLAYTADGKTLISGSGDKTVKLWDVAKGKEMQTLSLDDEVLQVALAPNGKTLATLGRQRQAVPTTQNPTEFRVRLWNVTAGQVEAKPRTNLALKVSVAALAFSPDNKTLATVGSELRDGSRRTVVQLWSLAGKELMALTPSFRGERLAITFVENGKLLALGGSNESHVLLLDAATSWERGRLRSHLGGVMCLAASKDGRTLVSGSFDQTLKVWETKPADERDVLRLHRDKEVYAVAFQPGEGRGKNAKRDQYLASAGGDGTIKVWNLTTGKETATLSGHQGSVLCLAFSPDGKRLISGGADGTVRLWNTEDVQKEFGKLLVTLTGPTQAVLCLAFNGLGEYLAAGSLDHAIYVWKLEEWAKVEKPVAPVIVIQDPAKQDGKDSLAGHKGPVRGLQMITIANRGVFLFSGSEDGTMRAWNLTKKTAVSSAEKPGAAVSALLWWPQTPIVMAARADRMLRAQQLALDEDKNLTLKSEIDLVIHIGGSRVLALEFAPGDSKTLAVGSWDGTVKLWDPQQRAERLTLRGHTGPVSSLAFSPNGRILASASYDGTVRLWRAAADTSGSLALEEHP